MGALITRDWKVYLKWVTHFPTVLCYFEGISLAAKKVYNSSGKHTHNYRNILVITTKWQVNEVHQQVPEGYKRGAWRPLGSKNGVSRVMDLTSQTLLIDCFCNFIEVSPLMSI